MATRPRTPTRAPLLLLLALVLLLLLQSAQAFQLPHPGPRHQPRQPPTNAPPTHHPLAPAALLLRRWGLLALAVLGPAVAPPSSALAFDAKGAKLFEDNCSSCHVGGSNIIGYARAKTLKADALKKYKVDNREAIVGLLEKGAGVMPKYSSYVRKNGDTVPAKLSAGEMGLVADYVLEMAKEGWK